MALLSFVALKTLFLIIIWISMGLCIEIFGPTLKDLTVIFDTDYEGVSRALSARGIGGCVGGVVGGILADKLPLWLDLMVTVYVATASLSIGLVSVINSADQMWFMCLLLGFGVGGTNIVGQRLILVMWKERSASPTHALHMGFGIGAVLIPLIANPFLMVVQPLDSNHTDSSTIMTTSNSSSVVTVMASTPAPPRFLPLKADNSPSNTTFDGHFFSTNITSARNDYQVISDSNVHYVFILVACLSFLSCLPFILYQSLNSEKCNPVFRQITDNEIKNTKKIRFLDMLNPASYTGGSMAFGITMFTLIFVYFTGTVGGEQLFGTFIRTFSVDLLQFSKDSASYLLMVYWLSFTLSRFLGSILSHLIHIKHLIVVQAIFNTASVTALNFLRKTSTNLWVFTCIQGVLYAPLYPMGISFANTVMDVRGFCLTVVSLAASLGDFGYIWIAGKLYDQFGPNGIMYTMQASGITILIAVCGFRLASWGRKAPDAKQFHTAPEKLEMSVNHAKRSEEITGLLDTSEDEL